MTRHGFKCMTFALPTFSNWNSTLLHADRNRHRYDRYAHERINEGWWPSRVLRWIHHGPHAHRSGRYHDSARNGKGFVVDRCFGTQKMLAGANIEINADFGGSDSCSGYTVNRKSDCQPRPIDYPTRVFVINGSGWSITFSVDGVT